MSKKKKMIDDKRVGLFFFVLSSKLIKKNYCPQFQNRFRERRMEGVDTEKKKKYEPKRFLTVRGTQVYKRKFRDDVSGSMSREQELALDATKGGRSYRVLEIDGSGT